ncbi:hypothetical protein B0H11DRAFT_2021230 [Mycena galericulata]|nr:hypothetical protein B0H11DRAFT_2021230 [Mycena galericulata]
MRPAHLRKCTRVATRATSGVLTRKRPTSSWQCPRSCATRTYPFPVMDGADEGVFTWVTARYPQDRARGYAARHAGVRGARPRGRDYADSV